MVAKPHHLLPLLNPGWFYLSGTGLPRLSWKRSRYTVVVVVVVVAVVDKWLHTNSKFWGRFVRGE